MSLHLCLDCATIYDVEPGVEKICPRCGTLLGLARDDKFDNAEPFNVIASWAVFGLPEKERDC